MRNPRSLMARLLLTVLATPGGWMPAAAAAIDPLPRVARERVARTYMGTR